MLKVIQSTPRQDAGVDSLAAAQLAHELGEEFGVELPPTLLFDHPTIEALAKHLTIRDTTTSNEARMEPAAGAGDTMRSVGA